MATINITAGNTSTGDLTLSDQGNTAARKNEKVTWKIQDGGASNVKAITRIYCNSDSTQLFVADPTEKGNSGTFEGTLKDSVTPGNEEEYSIDWTDSSDGTHTMDPKISIRQ